MKIPRSLTGSLVHFRPSGLKGLLIDYYTWVTGKACSVKMSGRKKLILIVIKRLLFIHLQNCFFDAWQSSDLCVGFILQPLHVINVMEDIIRLN